MSTPRFPEPSRSPSFLVALGCLVAVVVFPIMAFDKLCKALRKDGYGILGHAFFCAIGVLEIIVIWDYCNSSPTTLACAIACLAYMLTFAGYLFYLGYLKPDGWHPDGI